jgi:SSS family solute:Na+ symporter
VVQRVLSANNLRAAKMAPVIGSAFKMAVPLIVILPGLLALGLITNGHPTYHLVPADVAARTGQSSYDQVLPLMLIRYCGPGLLGLGITALVAGFMSGMAGNVSAFSTVWTYDIYGAYINKKAPDKHYVFMGRLSTVIGMLISIGTAYLVMRAASIMDYVQALFSFFIAPLFGTVILGMLWKRATNWGGFLGLLAGTVSSIGMFIYTSTGSAAHKAQALSHIALSPDAQPMAENMFRALWSWVICVVVTVIVSLMTTPKPDAELNGLVYGATIIPDDGSKGLLQKPIFWAGVVAVVFIALNIVFF